MWSSIKTPQIPNPQEERQVPTEKLSQEKKKAPHDAE